MNFYAFLLLAVALSLDTFAVALSIALCSKGYTRFQKNRYLFVIAFFHLLMPFVGWLVGASVHKHVSAYDHWIVFGLLGAIGGKMIYEGLTSHKKKKDECGCSERTEAVKYFSFSGTLLFGLALSVDAIVAGFACSMLYIDLFSELSQLINMLIGSVVIGVVAFVLTDIGLKIGKLIGIKIGEKSSLLGGVVLLVIGIKTLIEYLI